MDRKWWTLASIIIVVATDAPLLPHQLERTITIEAAPETVFSFVSEPYSTEMDPASGMAGDDRSS